MHKLTKVILIAIAVWWVILVVLFVFPHLVPILSGFAILLSLPVALVLFILSIVALVKDKKRLWPAVSIALILLVTFVTLTKLMRWGALANFYLNRARYESTTRTILAAPINQREQLCGDNCLILSNDPPRVSFHYIHGFLNWHDIVYDPSGALVRAKDYDERKQLNLYFVSAEHLTGDWYLGHFGD